MRVLLIEDDSTTAQSIELMLKSESFNFYTTDLGEEGVDLGKLYDYDIILLDLNLPDMSGYEVLRSLRVSKVKTPILILTGLVCSVSRDTERPCANSPRETSLGRASKILLAGIGVAIMVRSKLPWRRKCMPLYYMDPTIEGISLSWSSIENRACLIFLAVAFATVAAKPGNLPPRYESVGAPPAR
jgi:hypothetical protein